MAERTHDSPTSKLSVPLQDDSAVTPNGLHLRQEDSSPRILGSHECASGGQ